MKHNTKALTIVLLLVLLALVAYGGVVAQQSGRERIILAERLDAAIDSDMYPALRVQQDGSAPAFVVAGPGLTQTLYVYGDGSIATAGDVGVAGDITAVGDIFVTGSFTASNLLFGAQTVADLYVTGDTELTGTLDVKDGVYDSGGNLVLADNTTITGTVAVAGAAGLYGEVNVYDDAVITGTVDVGTYLFNSTGDLVVRDAMTITSDLDAQGDATFYAPVTIYDATLITDTLDVSGAAGFDDDVTVNADATVTGTLDVQTEIENTTGVVSIDDDATISGELDTYGEALFYQAVTVAAPTLITSTLDVIGESEFDDTVTINADTDITGTVDVQGYVWNSSGALLLDDDIVRVSDDLDVLGIADFAGAVTINNAADITGTLDVEGDVTINADAQITGTLDVLLPISDSGGDLMLDDDVAIVGGSLYDSSTDLYLNDAVNISGSVYDAGGTLVLGDATQITSTLDALGAISDSAGNLELNDDVAIGGGYGGSGVTISSAGLVRADGNLVVDGTTGISGTVSIGGGFGSTGCTFTDAGAASCNGTITTSAGDVVLTSGKVLLGNPAVETTGDGITVNGDQLINAEASGGNAGARNEFTGLSRTTFGCIGTGTNGSTETTAYMDDTPAGEWIAVDGDVVSSDDAANFRFPATAGKSLKLAFAASAADNDGAVINIVDDDLTGNELIGFWMRSSVALLATDVQLSATDVTTDTLFNICAVSAGNVNKWLWCDVDISALAGTQGDAVTTIGLLLKNAAGLAAFNLWIDMMYKYDATDDFDLGMSILEDGVRGVANVTAGANLVLGTDYFVSYRSGNDFLVYISNQSAATGVCTIVNY